MCCYFSTCYFFFFLCIWLSFFSFPLFPQLPSSGYNVIYKNYRDLRLAVLSVSSESELLTAAVLTTMDTVLATLLEGQMSSRVLLDNLDTVALVVNEVTEQGQIIDIDVENVIQKVNIRTASLTDNFDTVEHTLTSALSLATDHLFRSLRS